MNTLNRTTFYVNTKILNTLGYCSYHKFMQWMCVSFARKEFSMISRDVRLNIFCVVLWTDIYSKKRNHIIS
ncbi:hypothetical protein RCL_jg13850.t2 [Rhizophagus clarus]|uniref:Uncharacterized protein n=1 Tax=Rhizophagus clarus TaxID=94130 RepID=A0A8H3LTI4_9GLOM|nr:hypothetical protein RCL_jg13850.t2 [Rhizophagus clarus]